MGFLAHRRLVTKLFHLRCSPKWALPARPTFTIFLLEFQMNTLRQTLLSLIMAGTAVGTFAQTDAEQAQHHPVESAKKSAKAPMAKPHPMLQEKMAAMDSNLAMMRAMHARMEAAKTPEERKALMADHRKAMQDGMNVMGSMDAMGGMKGMGGMASGDNKGGMSMDMMGYNPMMEKRMDMMTSMMQMMMDRLPQDPAQ
jgi:hypothetical protein